MIIDDAEIPVNTGEESIQDIIEEIKNDFFNDTDNIGSFRPRLFVYGQQSHKRLLKVALRNVDGEDDRNLALVEATSLVKMCNTTHGILFFDEMFTDSITDETTEAVVCMAFTDVGVLITFMAYHEQDGRIVFENDTLKNLDIEEIESHIISTLAFSIANSEDIGNQYTLDYIELLRRRGHEIDILEEDEVDYLIPI